MPHSKRRYYGKAQKAGSTRRPGGLPGEGCHAGLLIYITSCKLYDLREGTFDLSDPLFPFLLKGDKKACFMGLFEEHMIKEYKALSATSGKYMGPVCEPRGHNNDNYFYLL